MSCPEPVTTSMGLRITPAYTLVNAPRAAVIVVPGGGVDSVDESPRVWEWLRKRTAEAEAVLSVCNGAFILAKAGLLDGLSATTFAGLLPVMLNRSLTAQFLIPMATSLAFGVAFTTLITLFLVPALHLAAEDVADLWKRRREAGSSKVVELWRVRAGRR